VAAVLRGDEFLSGASDERPPYVCLRVVNDDFPGSDHSGYWKNRTEVLSRVVALIADSGRAGHELTPQESTLPATLSSSLDAAIRREVDPDAMRRNRVAALKRQLPMYAGIAIVSAVLVLGVPLGHQWLKLDLVDRLMPHSVFGMGIDGQRAWLTGVVVTLAAALVAGQLLSCLGQLVSWTKAGGSAAVLPMGGLMVALGAGAVALALIALSRALASN